MIAPDGATRRGLMAVEVECFVSPFVIDEAARGDDEYARKRLEVIASPSCR